MSNDENKDPATKFNEMKNLIEKKQNPSENKLVFDHQSGQLLIESANSPKTKTGIVVDQIYQDGFF